MTSIKIGIIYFFGMSVSFCYYYFKRHRYAKGKRKYWVKRGRTRKSWNNPYCGGGPEDAWNQNFRMLKTNFLEPGNMIRPYAEDRSC